MRIPNGFPSVPFPGMRPFEPSDSSVFFGQDENIEALIEKLGRGRFVAVLGESGVGKSSLVKAGLIPELRKGNTSQWHVPMFRPGIAPIEELAGALADSNLVSRAGLSDIAGSLRAHRASLKDLIDGAKLPIEDRVLIVVDQFEELFRLRRPDDPRFGELSAPRGGREEDAALFVKLLLTAAASTRPVYVLVTMRAEFLGDCASFNELGEAMNKGGFLLPRMTREQYMAAIVEPLCAYECEIEPSLLHELLNETMAMSEDGLPLLQHGLRYIWNRRKGVWDRALSIADLMTGDTVPSADSKVAGTKDLLQFHLEEIYTELEKADLADPLERLARSLGEHDHKGRLIRRPVSWDHARETSFLEGADVAPEARNRNDKLLRQIIVTFRDPSRGRSFLKCEPDRRSRSRLRDESADCAHLEVSHEVILRRWPRLAEWFRDEKSNAEQFQYLAEQANRFPVEAGLLSGVALKVAERWVAEFEPSERWAERYSNYDVKTRTFRYGFGRTIAFIQKSVRARRKKRIRNAGLLLVFLALGFLAWFGFREQIQAEIHIREQIERTAGERVTNLQKGLAVAIEKGQDTKQIENELNQARSNFIDADSQSKVWQAKIQTISSADQKQIGDLLLRVDALNKQVLQLTEQLATAQSGLAQAVAPAELEKMRAELAAQQKSAPGDQIASGFWHLIWDSSKPAPFQVYSEIFPDATYAPVAKARVAKLCTGAAAGAGCETQIQTVYQPLPLRVSSGVEAALNIKKATPVYPPLARQARVSGDVIFNVLIDPEGNVASLEPLYGHPLLVQAAMDAILQWKYKPTLMNGSPVSVRTAVTIHFILSGL